MITNFVFPALMNELFKDHDKLFREYFVDKIMILTA